MTSEAGDVNDKTTGQSGERSDARKELRGLRVGVVASDARDKTRTVVVKVQSRHPKYGKYVNRSTRYQVHDPNNESGVGDRVEIANCRPISKTKSWRLVRIVELAPARAAAQREAEQQSPAAAG